MKSSSRRAILIALRPPVFMKLADVLHHRSARARPAEVSEPLITPLLHKVPATEVVCGIKLSPCSVACPSGTIYTSLWPHLCIELRGGTGGTSVSWPLNRVRICISDGSTAGMDASIRLLSMLPTAVRWRVMVEELFVSP